MASQSAKAELFASGVRRRVLEFILKSNGGYMSQACSSAEIFGCLYNGIMNLEPVKKPLAPGPFPGVPSENNSGYKPGYFFNGSHKRYLDRFILSPTHYSLVLYAALIEAGRLDADSMSCFNKDGSSLEQIGAEHSPGMEVMTGSLGQGLSQAVGMALARRINGEDDSPITYHIHNETSKRYMEQINSEHKVTNRNRNTRKITETWELKPGHRRNEALDVAVYAAAAAHIVFSGMKRKRNYEKKQEAKPLQNQQIKKEPVPEVEHNDRNNNKPRRW